MPIGGYSHPMPVDSWSRQSIPAPGDKYTGTSSRVDSRWHHTCRRPCCSLNLEMLMPRKKYTQTHGGTSNTNGLHLSTGSYTARCTTPSRAHDGKEIWRGSFGIFDQISTRTTPSKRVGGGGKCSLYDDSAETATESQ